MTDVIDGLQPYWLGLLIGFIVGLERERSQASETQAFGLRTFSLIGLLGAFTGTGIPEFYAALTTLFVLTAILLGYWRTTENAESADYGFTTEVSAFCVFVLGSISVKQPLIACILGAFVLALLAGRTWLHHFTRQRITKKEADAMISLIVVGAGILPLLPREPVDPWGLFVPFKLGSLVLALAFVQFLSYVLLKMFGKRVGFVLGGFLAGLVSSTAAFAHIRQTMESETKSSVASSLSYGAMSIAATTILSITIIVANSMELFHALLWSFAVVLGVIVITTVVCFFISRKETVAEAETKDPLNWKNQIGFAVILFVIIALTKAAADFVGDEALWLVSFLSGLFELQGVTFALAATESFSESLIIAMALGYVASLVSKMALIASSKNANWKAKGSFLGFLLVLVLGFVGPLFF
ncbi:MgtC/SapB family protein [Bdellovibrio sp. HCB2-146]|uniref:MgtC/SapB family protein n=1 Tax=Bdellovibrio sp. HCB2-146 TaxID=3394362 RepID=UPI0039BD633C